jgi:divalent metal cation (Fe/Co/Zn/Cd) transporter
VAVAGQDGAAVPAAEESLVWGWQAVGPAESGCRGVVQFGFSEARHSIVGIASAASSLVVMPVLSWAQRRAGRELGSLSAVADSKQTLLCTYLSAILLVGLLLNSLLGWSWADPIAALGIVLIAVREGINAWKGGTCCPAPGQHETRCGRA